MTAECNGNDRSAGWGSVNGKDGVVINRSLVNLLSSAAVALFVASLSMLGYMITNDIRQDRALEMLTAAIDAGRQVVHLNEAARDKEMVAVMRLIDANGKQIAALSELMQAMQVAMARMDSSIAEHRARSGNGGVPPAVILKERR